MNNKNFNVYLDCGSSRVRAGALNNIDPKNSFYYESDYFFNQLDIELNIHKIITNIEKNTNEYLNDINLMIDNEEILPVDISLSKKFDGSILKKNDIQFLIQDAKQQVLKNYPNQSVIHIIIKNYKIDNINFVSLPENINCNLLSVDIIFICLPKKIIEYYKNLFLKFNILVNQFFCSSYARSLNYKNNFTLSDNISFIDIGFNRTSITSFNNNVINFFHTIPIGGNHVTKDISKVLGLDLIEAEKIKLCFDKNLNYLNKKNISLDLVQKIIFSRVEEILELCFNSINKRNNFEKIVKFKIVLMGEGSSILDNKFKDMINFTHEIDLLEETTQDIFESATKLHAGTNKQEVVLAPKRQIKEGFFEKLFHFFK
tara:strand:- start:10 stop:1125 length:1116 start_codon:yes stop_codon:yes gene_type:complete